MIPEMRFLADQVTRSLFPSLGYPGLELEFDLTTIKALSEDESTRASREVQLLDRGVLTINEVRRTRNLTDVSWGEGWAKAPKSVLGRDQYSLVEPMPG
jgi:phage portal protein BeeE